MIDGHASLKRSQSAKAIRFSRTIVNIVSEVYTWLKSLPRGFGLEKCNRVFESCGFVTLSSLKHLRPGDIDAFFPSPEKLLLAEKNVLESEIKGMIDPESRIISLWPQELSQRFNSYSDTWENYYASSSYQTASRNQSSLPIDCRRTFYRQQQLPATLRSVQLLAVRRLNHWIERGMK